jgi:hypothetical protein
MQDLKCMGQGLKAGSALGHFREKIKKKIFKLLVDENRRRKFSADLGQVKHQRNVHRQKHLENIR